MRLFAALDLPGTILHSLDALMVRLKHHAPLQWSEVSNLHVTTKFIGEWPEHRLGELTAALRAVPTAGSISVRVGGLGWFPNPHAPRVFWAAVHAGEPLRLLAAQTDAATTTLGIPQEMRAFHPHLTLARIRKAVDLAPLRRAVAQLEPVEFGSFEARSQFLYLSKNSIYTKLEEFPL